MYFSVCEAKYLFIKVLIIIKYVLAQYYTILGAGDTTKNKDDSDCMLWNLDFNFFYTIFFLLSFWDSNFLYIKTT